MDAIRSVLLCFIFNDFERSSTIKGHLGSLRVFQLKMWIFLVFVLSATCLPFPWEDAFNRGTIILKKGQTYEIDQPIKWSGIEKLIISGSGSTVVINSTLKEYPIFTLDGCSTWIWESVNIHGSEHTTLFKMIGGSFFQMRGCHVTCSNREEISIMGDVSNIVLENNIFFTGNILTQFFDAQFTNKTKLTLTNNQWQGNYSLHDSGSASIVSDRNRWPRGPLDASWLQSGGFYHPEDDELCLPPVLHTDPNTTYTACLVSWFLEAIKIQDSRNFGIALLHPVEGVINDSELPAIWFFRGKHEIDMGGTPWDPHTIGSMINSTTIIKGLDSGWSQEKLQILVMRNSTLEFHGLVLRDKPRMIDVSVTTETSHFFILQSKLAETDIVATGNGHVHVQDSVISDFVLSASTFWGSGNILKQGRIITQPYAGHIQFSQMQDTEYHVSPFYLGNEPNYRLRFARNIWSGSSDIVFATTLSKEISMDQDTVESSRLARKLAYSPYIVTKGLLGRPRSLVGHIWPSSLEEPVQCPDGTTPGLTDNSGAHTFCVPCSSPRLSKGGVCNNLRAMEIALQDIDDEFAVTSQQRLGDAQAFFQADTSYLNFYTREKMQQDCYTCAALCLNIPPDQIETYMFTLPRLLQPKNESTTTECSKCALYCADLSGCASLCVPLEYQLLIAVGIFLLAIIPMGICFLVFFKPQRIMVEQSSHTKFYNCPYDPKHQIPEGGTYCPICGSDAVSLFPEKRERNRLEYDEKRQ